MNKHLPFHVHVGHDLVAQCETESLASELVEYLEMISSDETDIDKDKIKIRISFVDYLVLHEF